jgi:hypothetical protein
MEIIKSVMTHKPCSIEFSNASCMRRDNENIVLVCTKHYP